MIPVKIDPELCNQDGICAAVCPRKLIGFSPGDPLPRPIPEAEELCIRCGHCLAACPTGAVRVDGTGPADCPPYPEDLLPGPDAVDSLLRSRRSIRVFRKKALEPAVLERLLETCRHAPTGSNSQSVHWVVAVGRERMDPLAGVVVDWMRGLVEEGREPALRMGLDKVVRDWEAGQDRIFRGAPAVVATHAPDTSSLPREDCVIALTYLELAAFSLGLGTCWLGYLMLAARDHPPLKTALDLPPGHEVHGAMVIGHPRYGYHRLPPREEAKVVWLA